MAKSNPAQSAITKTFRQAQQMLGAGPVGPADAERFWAAQDNILRETETFARHWFERRHTATRTAMDAAKDIARSGASDPAAAMSAVTEWQSHSLERVTDDLRDWIDLCSRCAGHMAGADPTADADGSENTPKKASQGGRQEGQRSGLKAPVVVAARRLAGLGWSGIASAASRVTDPRPGRLTLVNARAPKRAHPCLREAIDGGAARSRVGSPSDKGR